MRKNSEDREIVLPLDYQRFRLMHIINRHARESGYPESFNFARVTGSPRARG